MIFASLLGWNDTLAVVTFSVVYLGYLVMKFAKANPVVGDAAKNATAGAVTRLIGKFFK